MENLLQLFSINPWILIVVGIWSVIWKGLALWKAAGLKAKWWFIVLLIINDAGVLEILYFYIFSKKSKVTNNGNLG